VRRIARMRKARVRYDPTESPSQHWWCQPRRWCHARHHLDAQCRGSQPTQSSCRTFTGKVSFSPGSPRASSSVVPAVVKSLGRRGLRRRRVHLRHVNRFANSPTAQLSLVGRASGRPQRAARHQLEQRQALPMSLVIDTVPANTTQLTLSGDVGSGLFAHPARRLHLLEAPSRFVHV